MEDRTLEFERKRKAIGPREGKESEFKLIDKHGRELPNDERKLEELVKAGKIEGGKVYRVHKHDHNNFMNPYQ